jgi:hypothetical protein
MITVDTKIVDMIIVDTIIDLMEEGEVTVVNLNRMVVVVEGMDIQVRAVIPMVEEEEAIIVTIIVAELLMVVVEEEQIIAPTVPQE